MKQCKLCGTPLGKEPTTEELKSHWKKHHNWHWESNKEKTPEDALLKKQKQTPWSSSPLQHAKTTKRSRQNKISLIGIKENWNLNQTFV